MALNYPVLRLWYGTLASEVIDLTDGTVLNLRENGFIFSPPKLRETYAGTMMRDGSALTQASYENTVIRVLLNVDGRSRTDIESTIANIERVLRQAQTDALDVISDDRKQRVKLEYRKYGTATTVWWDVLSGQIELPSTVHSGDLVTNRLQNLVLAMTCKPFCTIGEQPVAVSAVAIPRVMGLAGYTTDDGIGLFGSTTNVITNPVFNTVTTGWSSYGTVAAFSRVTNVRDAQGVNRPTAAYLRLATTATSGYKLDTGAGAGYTMTALVADTKYALSVDLRGRGSITLKLTVTGGTGSGSVDIVLTDTWTRYELVVTAGSGATDLQPALEYKASYCEVYATRWQLEQQSYATPFTPEARDWATGIESGWSGTNIYQLAPGHAWSGTAHASSATRTGISANRLVTVPLTPFSMAKGWTIALWAKSRGWLWNDSTEHCLFASSTATGVAGSITLSKGGNARLGFTVTNGFTLWTKARTGTLGALAGDVWHHIVCTLSPEGGVKLYWDGTAYTEEYETAGIPSRIESLPSSITLGSYTNGTIPFGGFIQVQAMLPYAIDQNGVDALRAIGQDGNRLAYIDANAGAVLDGTSISSYAGTATFTNRNGRLRFREVQGHVPAPFRLLVENPMPDDLTPAPYYRSCWLSFGDLGTGIHAAGTVDVKYASPGTDDADATAMRNDQSGATSYRTAKIASMSTSAVETIGTITHKSDYVRRRYRVLLRAKVTASGTSWQAELSTGSTVLAKRVTTPAASSYRWYDLGELTTPTRSGVQTTDRAYGATYTLKVGKASAATAIVVDTVALLPADYVGVWSSDSLNWSVNEDATSILIVDTTSGTVAAMPAKTDETIVYLPSGYVGDVLALPPGNPIGQIAATPNDAWGWDATWKIDRLTYWPQYLTPPGH